MSVLNEITDNTVQPISFPISGWCKDLSGIPGVTEETVEKYYRSRTSSRKHFNRSYKFLTESYIDAGSVKTVKSSKGLFFIKGKCFKSLKKNDNPYSVITALNNKGDIVDSNCSCPVGVGGFCNHLVSLLRLLVILKKKKFSTIPEALSCTDVPQQWNRPRNTSLNSVSVMEVDWRRPQEEGKTDPIECKLYEVRKVPRTKEEFSLAVTKLSASLRGDGLHTFSNILEDCLVSPYVNTKLGAMQVGSTLAHQASYEESNFSVLTNLTKYPFERSTSTSHCNASFEWPVFQSECGKVLEFDLGINYFPLPEQHQEVFQKVQLNLEEAKQLESETKSQFESETWKKNRECRITASRFGSICNRVMKWNKTGLTNIVSAKQLGHLIAIKYGVKTESVAASKYLDVMHSIGHPVQVFPCGLVVDPRNPWIGASPDRRVYDPREDQPYGLLEIKCPYSFKDKTPKDACLEPTFYVDLNGDKPSLHDKNYLCQVMGQLGVTGLQWCDFVVYFPSGVIIERIFFNAKKWIDMKKKLGSFYFEQMLPFMSKPNFEKQ